MFSYVLTNSLAFSGPLKLQPSKLLDQQVLLKKPQIAMAKARSFDDLEGKNNELPLRQSASLSQVIDLIPSFYTQQTPTLAPKIDIPLLIPRQILPYPL